MSKSIRIRTTPGDSSEKYIKVKLEQDFDFLELLSLKIDQTDVYQSFCSDYGVVAGRVIINDGFGVPNTKVSIFVPIDSVDINNQLISQVYPYETPNADEKNSSGIRYNLLPNTQQTLDHTPVGTFPEKREVLDNKVTFEVYEKYYKYTTTTNKSGDFIIFGIPVGTHILHYDMDLSDIGFLSARPYELIAQGFKKEDFENDFKFKTSSDLDKLPQIVSGNISVTIDPYWCDDLSTGRVMGINRQDISIESVKITPTAVFFGSLFSDDEKDSINKNCRPTRKMGKLSEVITGGGTVEAIRRTIDGRIENFDLSNSEIDDNGNWSILVPMNMRNLVTDEFGSLVPSNDIAKGVPSESDIRFKISMDAGNNDERLRQRASFLVPNMTSNYHFKSYSRKDLRNSLDWKINTQLSTFTLGTPYQNDLTNQNNYIEDFYTLRWKKVYTVKQYIGRYQSSKADETRAFTGVKDIMSGEGVNKFPSNRLDSNISALYWIICFLLSMFGIIVGLLNAVINQINGVITMLCQIKIPCDLDFCTSGCDKTYEREMRMTPTGGRTCNVLGKSTRVRRQTGGTVPASCAGQIFPNKYYQSKFESFMLLDGKQDYPCGCGSIKTDAACQAYYLSSTYKPSNLTMREKAGSYPGCTAPSWDATRNPSIKCAKDLGWVSTHMKNRAGLNVCDKKCKANCANGFKVDLGVVCFCINVQIILFCLMTNMFCKKCRSLCPGQDKFSCCDSAYTGTQSCKCYSTSTDMKRDSKDRIKKCRTIDCGTNPKSYKKTSDNNTHPWCKIPKDNRVGTENKTYSGDGFCDPRNCGCGQKGDDTTPDGPGTADMTLSSGGRCCNDCCGKVPLIRLDCAEDASFKAIAPIVLLPTIFAAGVCNETLIIPFSCHSCSGQDTPYIKDWVACKLENLAGALNMLQFDFYNDWINGALYFPLFKRKYNVKKRKKKLGQIKKDKFCDYDCDEFQGQPYYTASSIKLKNAGPTFTIQQPMEGDMFCNAVIKRSYKYVTNYYGGYDEDTGKYLTPGEALNLAAQEISFKGKNTNKGACEIKVDNYLQFVAIINPYSNFKIKVKDKKIGNKHGKPEYVQTEDPATGLDTWKNIGGHSHHKNKCNSVYLHERSEYFKPVMDCKTRNENTETPQGYVNDLSADDADPEGGDDEGISQEDVIDNAKGICDGEDRCDVRCGADGVGACTLFCKGNNSGCQNDNYNGMDVRHGIVKWLDGELYYVSRILKDDETFNDIEYKANLFFPTDISELGSTSYCDIDEIPFIMDSLVATTFQVSEDQLKVRTKEILNTSKAGINDGNPFTPIEIKSIKEKSTSNINLRAYVEYGCSAVKCMNIYGAAVQSQLGVDMIDSNDLGLQTRSCFLRFDHDEDVRGYFCRRFSGFKDGDLNVNYMRPGSPQFENTYKPYSEIVIKDQSTGVPVYYITPEGDYIESLYNGGEPFIPGDRCGLTTTNNIGVITNIDYFYAVAPGQTPNLIDFPNGFQGISDANAANTDFIDDDNYGIQRGVKFSRAQTPYYFYFGLVPGSTALHKVVSQFFADKINKITLRGVGDDGEAAGNETNVPPAREPGKSVNEIFKTCLGETLTP